MHFGRFGYGSSFYGSYDLEFIRGSPFRRGSHVALNSPEKERQTERARERERATERGRKIEAKKPQVRRQMRETDFY